jgi:hypothetical protein
MCVARFGDVPEVRGWIIACVNLLVSAYVPFNKIIHRYFSLLRIDM